MLLLHKHRLKCSAMKKDSPKIEYNFTRLYTVFEKSYQKTQTKHRKISGR